MSLCPASNTAIGKDSSYPGQLSLLSILGFLVCSIIYSEGRDERGFLFFSKHDDVDCLQCLYL